MGELIEPVLVCRNAAKEDLDFLLGCLRLGVGAAVIGFVEAVLGVSVVIVRSETV